MRLMKKAILFASLIPALCSCSTSSIAGTYGFQLGKETGTHFGVYLKMTDKAYVPSNPDEATDEQFKQFNMTVTVKTPIESEMMTDIDRFLSYFKDGLPGYYRLTNEKNDKQEQRVKVGFDFESMLTTIKAAYETETGESFPVADDDLNDLNDSKLIQSLLYVTYKEDKLNFYVPVSLADVYYQLYWYGIDIKMSLDDFEIVDVTPHPVGSKPTKEEIAVINETFEADHEGCFFFTEALNQYRCFNQVTLGLVKK